MIRVLLSSTIRWLFSSVSGTALAVNCNFHFSHLNIDYSTQPVFWHSNDDWISNYGSSPASHLSLPFRSTITFHYLCIVVDTHLCRSHLSCGWRWSHNKVNMLTNLCLQFSQTNWGKIKTLFNSEVCTICRVNSICRKWRRMQTHSLYNCVILSLLPPQCDDLVLRSQKLSVFVTVHVLINSFLHLKLYWLSALNDEEQLTLVILSWLSWSELSNWQKKV